VPQSPPDFSAYRPDQAERLAALLRGTEWQAALADQGRLAALRDTTIAPPAIPDPVGLLEKALLAVNEEAVRDRIARGERDVAALAGALGRWPDHWTGPPPSLSFVGVTLTLACDAQPRCEYCNQRLVAETLPLAAWRDLVLELTAEDRPRPYFSYTGGEPLTCGEGLYGPRGLVRLAAERGAASNINTNALSLTPEVALSLVQAGTARLHISLDSPFPHVQDALAREPGRFDRIVAGLTNVQIAREVLGANHPGIHVNCVMTTRNLFDYPELVRFLLERKRVRTPGAEGAWRADPHYRDLGLHLIPVGGRENAPIRPSAEQYRRFFEETWEDAARVWDTYQDVVGVPADERVDYPNYAFFANPYRRVRYAGDLADYTAAAAESLQSALGLGSRCLVAPTQAFFLPDGSQHWCGGRAVSRPEPMGRRQTGEVLANTEGALPQLAGIPDDFCRGCPVATIFINQSAEAKLEEHVGKWIEEGEAQTA